MKLRLPLHKNRADDTVKQPRKWSKKKSVVIGLLIGMIVIGTPFAYAAYKSTHRTDSPSTGVSKPSNSQVSPSASQQSTPVTPPPAKSANTKPGASTGAIKPYIAGVCTRTPIPYETIYTNTYTLPKGQSEVHSPGKAGYTNTCTADSQGHTWSDLPVPSVPEVIYVGVANPTTPPSGGISYQEAQSSCLALGTGDSSAFEQCMHAYGY